MKKLFYFNLVIACMILCFALSSSSTMLPANSRAFTGKITKIFKDKTKRNILIKIQARNKSIIAHVPLDDPLKIMGIVKKYRGKLITVIYSYPDMTIINIIKNKRKKTKKL